MAGSAITVRLAGGSPWGFRLQGGRGTGLPLTITKTRRKSKAYQVLLEGDQLISINGQPCEYLSHDEAMAIVESGCPELVIQVRRGAEHNKENENQPKDNPHPKIETQAPANAAAPVWTAPTGSSFFPKTSPTGSSTLSKSLLTSTSTLPRAGLTLLGPLSDLGNIPRPFVPFQDKSPGSVREVKSSVEHVKDPTTGITKEIRTTVEKESQETPSSLYRCVTETKKETSQLPSGGSLLSTTTVTNRSTSSSSSMTKKAPPPTAPKPKLKLNTDLASDVSRFGFPPDRPCSSASVSG